MINLYYATLALVIAGHLLFAFLQWFKWDFVCKRMTDLTGPEVERTAFLGRSFASYNASVGVGLLLSCCLDPTPQAWVQGVVLALIVATAAVGAAGAQGNAILKYRLSPAAAALIFLLAVRLLANTPG